MNRTILADLIAAAAERVRVARNLACKTAPDAVRWRNGRSFTLAPGHVLKIASDGMSVGDYTSTQWRLQHDDPWIVALSTTPRVALRAIRRLQAAEHWLHRVVIARRAEWDSICRQQAAAVLALEAEQQAEAMRGPSGSSRTRPVVTDFWRGPKNG